MLTTWSNRQRAPYQGTIDAMYKMRPDTDPGDTSGDTHPDNPQNPDNLVLHRLPRPFNIRNFTRELHLPRPPPLSIREASDVLSSLAGNPPDLHMQATTTTSGWGTVNVHAIDRRGVEEGRKFAASFVAAQFLLIDFSVSTASAICISY